jgi:hypothetical protein
MRWSLKICALLGLIFSCGKPDQEVDPTYGYFKGTFNGVEIESSKAPNSYKPLSLFSISDICDLEPSGSVSFVFKPYGLRDDGIDIGFKIGKIKKSQGEKYKTFNSIEGVFDCDKLPSIHYCIGSDAFTCNGYSFIQKDSYLKISSVSDKQIEGCFKVKFRSKYPISKDADKLLSLDSTEIICEKFIAVR